MADEVETVETPPEAVVAEETTDDVQKSLDDLKAKLAQSEKDRDTANARASQAEYEAREARARIGNADDEVRQSQLTVVSSAIDMLNTEKGQLKSAYAEAMTAGDFAAAADVQDKMATNAAKLLNLENGKAAMEAAPRPQPRALSRTVDPVEQFAEAMEMRHSPRAAAWIRQHPEYARDQRLSRKMVAAHELAAADGLKAETDEYFAHVERTLKIGHTDAAPAPAPQRDDEGIDVPMSAAAEPVKSRQQAPQQPPAAPVNRGSNNGRTIRLTSEQVDAARISGLSPEEYARNMEKVRKDRANGRAN